MFSRWHNPRKWRNAISNEKQPSLWRPCLAPNPYSIFLHTSKPRNPNFPWCSPLHWFLLSSWDSRSVLPSAVPVERGCSPFPSFQMNPLRALAALEKGSTRQPCSLENFQSRMRHELQGEGAESSWCVLAVPPTPRGCLHRPAWGKDCSY